MNSTPNAILGIILPDENGDYGYANQEHFGFDIINNNQNNLKYNYSTNKLINGCSESYILTPTWEQFKKDYQGWIEAALEIRQNIDKYEVSKTV